MTLRTAAPLLLFLYAALFLAPGFFTLPPLDRDESRFVQSSKQMMETGDLVEIRLQDEARNRKPVGIYWMQVASATPFGGVDAPVWAFRIPSALGAVLAVVFTYLAGVALTGRTAALAGAAVFAISVLMVTEGHIAKTDAMLCAAITATQAGLARAFMRYRSGRDDRPWSDTFLIWVGLGLSLLIKGPVGPMVAGLTIFALWIFGSGLRWLRATRPLVGTVLVLLIVLPWAVAITVQTGWSFWFDALFGDMLPKAVGGQEGHGNPPGYFIALATVTFFPASILLMPALWRLMRMKAEAWAIFLIAWVVPTWIAFEAFPTKLPHYVLPLYPALALAVGAYLTGRRNGEPEAAPRWARLAQTTLWCLTAITLAALMVAAPDMYGWGAKALDVLLAIAVLAAAGSVAAVVWMQRWPLFLPLAAMLSALVFAVLFERSLPVAVDLHISPRLAAAVRAVGYRPGMPIAATGYAEPSLVVLTSTDIALLPSGAEAARFLKAHPGGFALVERRQLKAFYDMLGEIGGRADRVGSLDGFNYSRGQAVTVAIFRERAPR